VPVVILRDRESSDEIVVAKRLTGRKLASAWSLALVAFAAFATIGLADLIGSSGAYQRSLSATAPPACDQARAG
jgi:hypothetical protein